MASAQQATDFTLEKHPEYEFRLKPLPVGVSLELLPNVLELVPLLAAARAENADPALMLRAMSGMFRKLRPILDVFKEHCACRAPGSKTFLDMSAILDNVFAREIQIIVEWINRCLKEEYGDFLDQAFQKPKQPEKESDSDSPSEPEDSTG